MEKIRILAQDLVEDAEKILKNTREFPIGRFVRIIPEKDFDPLLNNHPLEDYLRGKGLVYYFSGDSVGKENDYEIDLTNIDVVYHKENFE